MENKRDAVFSRSLEINIPQHMTDEDGLPNSEKNYSGLGELFQNCRDPLSLSEVAETLLVNGAVVNAVDCHGNAPLFLLALHVNRGLSYVDSLVTVLAERQRIHETCVVDVHEKYQLQVFRCLEMLLDRGADGGVIPATCPSVIHQVEWNELFELKLVQSKSRWLHLRTGISMQSNKHSAFDPLLSKRLQNARGVRIVHLLAWRGDVRCLELLLGRCSVEADACTSDGWNAFHFLYFYCLKPSDLVAATKLLIDCGVDVNQAGHGGITPIHLLLRHILVKRSHVKYLASAPRHDHLRSVDIPDNYCEEIRRCLDLLLGAGAKASVVDPASGTPLHVIFESFRQSLVNCDWEFQTLGHEVVPYSFRLDPVVEFVDYFVHLRGFNVNAVNKSGQTALHVLTLSLKELCFDESLNPTATLSRTFSTLLRAGVDPNILDSNQQTVGHIVIELATSAHGAFVRYNPIFLDLLNFGARFDSVDQNGNSMLHHAVKRGILKKERLLVMKLLLRCGADPSWVNSSLKTPLEILLKQHIDYELCDSSALLKEVVFLCRMMTRQSFNRVACGSLPEGLYGVNCSWSCPVVDFICGFLTKPRSLRDVCCQVIRRSMGWRFLTRCQKDLPLPKSLCDYLFQLVS